MASSIESGEKGKASQEVQIDVSQVDERKLVRKIDLRLIPWLSLLYLLSFLDRTSIGNAKVFLTNFLSIQRHYLLL
jgi:hypothetical protein